MTTQSSSPFEVRWTMTDRGFKHYAPITTEFGDEILVYESSAAESPHLWISTNGETEHVTLEQAAALRDHPNCLTAVRETLATAILRHYQMPQPDPKLWRAGDACAMCGSRDTGEEDGAAFCNSCGVDDRV